MHLLDFAAAIAIDQLGLVARRQLLARGASADTIDAAVHRGHLRPIRRGVYLMPGAPQTFEVRMLAVLLAVGPGAMFSHRTAAWLWELRDAPNRHELSVPRPHRPRMAEVRVHRSRDLHLAIPGVVRGLPVTGVGRTILDCASDPTVDIELLVDAARRKHRISRTLLPATVVAHSCSGRTGIQRLRDLVVTAELPRSDFERMVARWLRDQGVTGWEMLHRIVVPARRCRSWPSWRPPWPWLAAAFRGPAPCSPHRSRHQNPGSGFRGPERCGPHGRRHRNPATARQPVSRRWRSSSRPRRGRTSRTPPRCRPSPRTG